MYSRRVPYRSANGIYCTGKGIYIFKANYPILQSSNVSDRLPKCALVTLTGSITLGSKLENTLMLSSSGMLETRSDGHNFLLADEVKSIQPGIYNVYYVGLDPREEDWQRAAERKKKRHPS